MSVLGILRIEQYTTHVDKLRKAEEPARVYDNEQTFDRYTVYDTRFPENAKDMFPCLAMSADPHNPLGFCQHSTGAIGPHNGKEIHLIDMPYDCQMLALKFLGG